MGSGMMKTGIVGKALFKLGWYQNRVEGPNKFGVTRNRFGRGRIVGVWGGGISPEVERNQLNQLLNPEARFSARERILDRILSRKIRFEHINLEEVRSALEQLASDAKLGVKAKEALKIFPPSLLYKEEAVKVERVEDSSPMIEVIQLSVMLSGGESGVLDGEAINQPDLGGICAASGRKRNEDGLSLRNEERRILITVADGMGGHAGGEIASALALKEVDNTLALQADSQSFSLKDAFAAAHNTILAEKITNPKTKEMGTTAVSAFIEGNRARIVNVGDTRAFLLRKGNLILLTRDDGSLPSMYEAAEKKELKLPLSQKQTKDYFDYSQGKKDTNFDILYKALGREQDKNIRVQDPIQELRALALELKEDDMLLFLSDGGYKYFKDFEDFRGVILANAEKNPVEIAQAVEAAAKERMSEKGGDNVTVAVYKHRPVSEISDSMIIQDESLSDSAIREALEEESTTVWERPTTQEMLETTRMFTASPDDAKVLAEEMNKSSVLKEAVDKAARLIVEKNRMIAVLGKKNEDLEHAVQIAENELRKSRVSLEKELGEELAPLSALITGTTEQKMDILDDILNGNYDLTGKEFLVIALIAQGVMGSPAEVTERAQDAINLIII